MSELDDNVRQTKEFIEDAEQVIAKTKDMIAALNKLINKNSDHRPQDPKRTAHYSQLEEDLEALMQRYLGNATAGSPASTQDQMSRPLAGDSPPVRPGRFRPRI
jgi:hypothetical protein